MSDSAGLLAGDSDILQTLVPNSLRGREMLAKFFRALGDPSRLALLDLLLRGEKNVSECVEQLGLAQSRVSSHLACLAECGYVSTERRGRFTFYSVTDKRVERLVRIGHALAEENAAALAGCARIDQPNDDSTNT